ncbi:hypothetical protein HBI70_199170 [Parastagonospora nodorum]|nr:hypothetical protein HBH50_219030 [Parastagonospora nodorum]KAH4080069.1 hypothetical protein HBH48_211420 [Parastagonospora nodorum]KAH4115346.1 hypothetical protein HBH47_182160 [Parastagonospora nodorum]KAH4156401.1 hypothetical protein HBH43_207300 [Parastagonospora nodorum]KAH4599150.1 hypothetical protein HBH82_208430 [Parastagonospora nodorum]
MWCKPSGATPVYELHLLALARVVLAVWRTKRRVRKLQVPVCLLVSFQLVIRTTSAPIVYQLLLRSSSLHSSAGRCSPVNLPLALRDISLTGLVKEVSRGNFEKGFHDSVPKETRACAEQLANKTVPDRDNFPAPHHQYLDVSSVHYLPFAS